MTQHSRIYNNNDREFTSACVSEYFLSIPQAIVDPSLVIRKQSCMSFSNWTAQKEVLLTEQKGVL